MTKHILIVFGCLISSQLLAQGGSSDRDKKEVDVVGVVERQLKDAFKIEESPQVVDTFIKTPDFNYYFVPRQAKTSFVLQPIKPARLKVLQPLPKLHRGYFKGGVGMYLSPLAEIYYNGLRSKKSTYGMRFRHHSSVGGVRDAGPSGMHDDLGRIWVKRFFGNNALTAAFDFESHGRHYYGYDANDTTINVTKDDIKQRFDLYGGNIGWRAYKKDSTNLNYSSNLDYYHYKDRYQASENRVVASGNFFQYLEAGQLFNLDALIDVNNFNYQGIESVAGDSIKLKNNDFIISANPTVETGKKLWKVKAGLGLAMEAGNTFRVHFYPDVEAKFNLYNNMFVPYAGITGGLDRNSYRSITAQNPWVLSDVELRNGSTAWNMYAGIKGAYSSRIAFNVGISKKKVKNELFYAMDTLGVVRNQFDVIYDTVTTTSIFGELSFSQGEKVKVFLKGRYNTFNLKTENYAWDRPKLEISTKAVFDLRNKLLIKPEIYYVGKRMTKSMYTHAEAVAEDLQNGPWPYHEVEINGYLDVNLDIEYRYTKRLSAWISFKNIAGKAYPLYYKYNTYQYVNVMGGFTYSFL